MSSGVISAHVAALSVHAANALGVLAENGSSVARLEEGAIEWQLAGYNVE